MAQVLIAEDDPISQKVILKIVEGLGLNAIVADNGAIAWRILQSNKSIKLLVTDMMMPEIDGRELVKRVRKMPEFEKLPILLVSAYVGIKEIDDLLKMGVTRFLPKPINVAEVRDYIKRFAGA